MKIVDRMTFLNLPGGTLFAKYAPAYFQEPLFKQDSIYFAGGNDFWYSNFHDTVEAHDCGEAMDVMDRAEAGESVALDLDVWARDGLFDAGQLFAVYEAADLDAMIAKLQTARAALTPTGGDHER
jgi:hypothetical protein